MTLPTIVAPAITPGDPRRTGAWVSFGLAGATAITGAVLYAIGFQDVQSLSSLHEVDYPDRAAFEAAWVRRRNGRFSEGTRKIYASYAMFGATAAALGAGLALYLTSGDSNGAKATVLTGGPGDAGVTALVSW